MERGAEMILNLFDSFIILIGRGTSVKPHPLQCECLDEHTCAELAEFCGCDRGNDAALCAVPSSAMEEHVGAGCPSQSHPLLQTHLNLGEHQPLVCR